MAVSRFPAGLLGSRQPEQVTTLSMLQEQLQAQKAVNQEQADIGYYTVDSSQDAANSGAVDQALVDPGHYACDRTR